MMTLPPRRRWFRFSLRTMLVLVTLVSLFCWYLQWAMNWKRQREAFLYSKEVHLADMNADTDYPPFLLIVVGAYGYSRIKCEKSAESEARSLFPEASVNQFYEPPSVAFPTATQD